MKYLAGCNPQDVFPSELSNAKSKNLITNIISKNIKVNNVLMAGVIIKIYLITINLKKIGMHIQLLNLLMKMKYN